MLQHRSRAAARGLLTLALLAAPCAVEAYDFKIVHVFGTTADDGYSPQSTPLLARDGNIYGTTDFGGALSCGVVYKLAPDGTYSIFYTFGGFPTGDGCLPRPGLTQDRDGNLYGATSAEGGFGATGAGMVYKLAPDGTETILHSFDQYNKHDGDGPFNAPIPDSQGNLYGTTPTGGVHDCPFSTFQCGTIYRIKQDGSFSLLYSFKGHEDSASPVGTLIRGGDGKLYGTAAYTSHYSYGTVFKIDPHGKGKLQNVYAFQDHSTGGNPNAGLVVDSAGNFYGTTNTGGADNKGTIFKVTPDGTETVLHSFTGADGASPWWGNLARDKAGNFYGTAYAGGAAGGGVVYQLTPDGTLNVLHSFDCGTGPCSPVGGVILDRAGNIFGTTLYGFDQYGAGTLFELTK